MSGSSKTPVPAAKTRARAKDSFPWWVAALGLASLGLDHFLTTPVAPVIGAISMVLLGALAGNAFPKKWVPKVTTLTLIGAWWAMSVMSFHAIGGVAIVIVFPAISLISMLVGWENIIRKFPAGQLFLISRRKKELIHAIRTGVRVYVEACRLPVGTKLVKKPEVTPAHITMELQLPAGSPANVIAPGHGSAAASALGLPQGSVRTSVGGDNSVIRVQATLVDPLKEKIPWPGLPLQLKAKSDNDDPKELRSVTDGIVLGVNRLGDPWIVPLIDNHLLIAGMSGSGKTIHAFSLALQIASYPDSELHIYDTTKRGSDFGALRHRCTVFVDHPDHTADALEDLYALMEQRYQLLAARGRNGKWSLRDGNQVVVVIDEAASIVRKPRVAKGEKRPTGGTSSKETLQHLAAECRGAGVTLIVATQTPQHQIFDVNTRRNLPTRICHKVESDVVAGIVLGVDGIPAHVLEPGTGMFYAVSPGVQGVESARGYWLEENVANAQAAKLDPTEGYVMAQVAQPKTGWLHTLAVHPVLASNKWATPILKATATAEGPLSQADLCRLLSTPAKPVDKSQIRPTLGKMGNENPALIKLQPPVNGKGGGWVITDDGRKAVKTISS